MRIKRFTAQSLKEATEQMKNELGPEAIILNSRKMAKGGMFGKEMFEITAAIDDIAPSTSAGTYTRPAPADRFRRQLVASTAQVENPVDGLRRVAEQFESRNKTVNDRPSAGLLELRSEMEDMKGTLQEIAHQLKHANLPSLPEALKNAYLTLMDRDVDQELALSLVQTVHASLSREQMGNKLQTERTLLAAMSNMVPAASTQKARKGKPRVIALVGPTGVGKTTTIAKLAAIHKLLHHQDVGLISTDTYRIGAIDQLRTFATIADIPMEVIYKPSEMAGALKKFRNRDLILVDTVGRSQRSKKDIGELAKFVAAANPEEVHLVLSASTSLKTSLDIIKHFATVKPNRLLFSKLDEAVTLGPLLSIIKQQRLPVAYVTTGQTVPDDILPVQPGQLASMVYTGEIAHA